jgi:hypothetical protein
MKLCDVLQTLDSVYIEVEEIYCVVLTTSAQLIILMDMLQLLNWLGLSVRWLTAQT